MIIQGTRRNHPLLLLSGLGTNAIGYDLAPDVSFYGYFCFGRGRARDCGDGRHFPIFSVKICQCFRDGIMVAYCIYFFTFTFILFCSYG